MWNRPSRKYFFIVLPIFSFFFLTSCGSQKGIYKNIEVPQKGSAPKISSDNNIVRSAEEYLGTPYQFGGLSKSGLDCSGLVYLVSKNNGTDVPRTSSEQSKLGTRISYSEIRKGDLLFFATSGGKKVSHVGIVHHIDGKGTVYFIHASTSKGVIISSLEETYWKKAYLFCQRVF